MTFRKSIFWVHLGAGLIAGISIAVMCVTGVALAFEKQLVNWSERDARRVALPSGEPARLPVDELLRRVRELHPELSPAAITEFADPRAAVNVSLGRDHAVFVDPYTGEVRRPASTAMRDFMHRMEDWHRFLALTGDRRPVGKMINGVCNLAFLLLAITGLYLWFPKPKRRSWASIRTVLWFQRGLAGKRRDFNWHNVIGLWSAPVLIVLTLTAVPISFRWGSALVYRLVGEEPPAQAGPAGSAVPPLELPAPPPGAQPLSREAQFAAVRQAFPDREQITLRLAAPGRRGATSGSAPGERSVAPERRRASGQAEPLALIVKTPGGWPRTATTTVQLDLFTGNVLRIETFEAQSTGRRLRTWTRFLHTGEALGWPGQLIAGFASLGGCLLVYTGVALSWRRFFRAKPGPSEAKRSIVPVS